MGQRRTDDGYTVHPQGAGGIPTLEYRGEVLPVDDPLQLRGVADAPLLAGELPVLLGCGTGRVMEQLSAHFQGAVAVVDAEGAIQKAFEARKHLPLELDVLWVDEGDADQILEELRSWQAKHEGAALRVFASSTYLKIRPRLYATILRGLKSRLGKGEKAPGRGGRLPRILLLRFNYFLEQEILAGLRAQDAPVREFAPQQDELADANAYVQGLLQAVGEWRPDYVLSVNSLASDAGGALSDLLQRLGVGYVTWFVDSPELFLHGRELPEGGGTVFFSCDPDFRAKLTPQTKGALDNVHYLPLAADHTRFDLKSEVTSLEPRMKVSFLGTTWVDKLAATHMAFSFPRFVLKAYRELGRALLQGAEPSVALFLRKRHPEFWERCQGELDIEEQKGMFHLLCWEANRIYRKDCMGRILPYCPLIAGDRHWERHCAGSAAVTHPPVGYYTDDLQRFYRLAAVNFNCGGVQMRHAVNQRVFDVPASGGFLLTDRRSQLEECFEPGLEAMCYDSPEEIPDMVERCLASPSECLRIINAARRRIVEQHTYVHRLRSMLSTLRKA